MRKTLFRTLILGLVALSLAAPADAQKSRTKKRTTSSATAKKKHPVRRVRKRTAPAPPPVTQTTPTTSAALASDLGMMVSKIRSGTFGVMVISLTRGDTLFAENAGEPMMPASTMKLLTSALAFERLGPGYQFSTDALRAGTLAPDGTLMGDIFIRGDGDPAFSGRFLGGGPATPVNKLAELVASQGIKRVTGNVVGDASAFDDQRIPEGWLTRYLQSSYAARVSALSLNENLVWVTISPGGVSLEPSTSSIPLVNNVRVTSGGRARLSIRRQSDGTIIVGGSIGSNAAPRRYEYVVEDPASFTTGAFRNALIAQGIKIDGGTRLGRAPFGAVKIASLVSPTMDRMIAAMNRESINHYAELIFRNAARGPNRDAQASIPFARSVMRKFFAEKVHADTSQLIFADGSGLSIVDRVTPRAMTQLLSYAHHSSWGPWFHSSLPVAGESELLRRRMRGGQAQGNLHAKTGTTNDVIGLAGYVTALDGEVMAFSFLYNGRDRWVAKSIIDVMGSTLANFAR